MNYERGYLVNCNVAVVCAGCYYHLFWFVKYKTWILKITTRKIYCNECASNCDLLSILY